MALPDPKPGLVVHYSYLWAREHRMRRDEGSKDRPAVVVVAIEEEGSGLRFVTVAPITHLKPTDASAAIEIPAQVKQALGLDDAPSWIIVNEANRFEWPGHDLRPIPASNPRRYHYGFIPPRLYDRVLREFIGRWSAGTGKPIPR